MPPKRSAGEPANAPPVRKTEQASTPAWHLDEEAGSNMHDVSGAAARQYSGVPSDTSRPSRASARKSLFSTPEHALSGQRPGSPDRPAQKPPIPTPQVAPTPTYISRSQQQESSLSLGVVDSRRAAVQASPAVSEMVYELRPATARSSQFPVHAEHNNKGNTGSRHDLDWAQGTQVKGAWQRGRENGAMDAASAGPVGSPEGAARSMPKYSGFSSEMRAAAQAMAAALLADATWHGDSAAESAQPNAQPSTNGNAWEGEGNSGFARQVRGDWGAASGSFAGDHIQDDVRQDSQRSALLSLDELEQQIASLNMTLEAEEGGVPEEESGSMVQESSSAQPRRRNSQQSLGTCFGLAASPTKKCFTKKQ